jgi:hypothetical protein
VDPARLLGECNEIPFADRTGKRTKDTSLLRIDHIASSHNVLIDADTKFV